ncbi:hypothetical protein T439DRAFT_323999 [Meredithblackwellia eburnea MCA 4105]
MNEDSSKISGSNLRIESPTVAVVAQKVRQMEIQQSAIVMDSDSGSAAPFESYTAEATAQVTLTAKVKNGQMSDFNDWMKEYAAGNISLVGSIPVPPEFEHSSLEKPQEVSSTKGDATTGGGECQKEQEVGSVFGCIGDKLDDAQAARRTFIQKGYLPAVTGPFEEERRKVLKRFKLNELGPGNLEVDRIVDMAAAIFNVPIVVVSLVLENMETFCATLGWDPNERLANFKRIEIPLETALCPHAMLKPFDEESIFLLESTADDWRFKNNPYCNEGPIGFFASANVHLPSDLTVNSTNRAGLPVPEKLPVGSICIVDYSPRPKGSFTDADAALLRSLSDQISREFLLSFERAQQYREQQRAEYLGEILQKLLVNPSTPESKDDGTDSFSSTLKDAATRLIELTDAESCVVFDLRAFYGALSTTTSNGAPGSPTSASGPDNESSEASTPTSTRVVRPFFDQSKSSDSSIEKRSNDSSRVLHGFRGGDGSVSILTSAGSGDWSKSVADRGFLAAISHTLIRYAASGQSQFDDGTTTSPLKVIFPIPATASISVPVYSHEGRPALLVVVCSTAKYFQFEPRDTLFIKNWGGAIMGGLLRRRILEADRAKLAFVSTISHELRTPLHGIRSQLEFMRSSVGPRTLKAIEPQLDVADTCCSSLREILDDTLEFAKMSNEKASDLKPASTEANLELLLEEVAKSCWARDSYGRQSDLDLLIDYQLSSEYSRCFLDVGGLKRVLINLVGNSFKYTNQGTITISAHEVPRRSAVRRVQLQVIDTGKGMSKDFLRSHLFIPFRQEDSFSQGAGLGLSICDSICQRLGGDLTIASDLGKGTIATVTIPVALMQSSKDECTDLPRGIRDMSAELRKLSLRRPSDPSLDDETREQLFPPPLPTSSPPQTAAQPDSLKLKVLVVDDNKIARTVLVRFLQSKHIACFEAEDGQIAIEQFQQNHPNVIWCDLQMPRVGGVEACLRIREIEQREQVQPAYIVALSGLSRNQVDDSSLVGELGPFDEWIVKGQPLFAALGRGMAKVTASLKERMDAAMALENRAAMIRHGKAISLKSGTFSI